MSKMKSLSVTVAIATIGFGVASAAEACVWQSGPFGPVCVPAPVRVCAPPVWIPTGPFFGQGYWAGGGCYIEYW